MVLFLASLRIALLGVAGSTVVAPVGDDDPVLRAMGDELSRYQSLKEESLEAPYHVSASLTDDDSLVLQASFGALVRRIGSRRRSARADVRVGNPALDNTNFSDSGFDSESRRQTGPAITWEGDYDAVRQSLWLRLDRDYKRAVEVLARKRAYLATNLSPNRPSDFAPADVTSLLAPRAELTVDEDRWTRIVRQASAVFRDESQAISGTATLRTDAYTRYIATTDGLRVRVPAFTTSFVLAASAQATDGMEVELHCEIDGRTEADLPTEFELIGTARTLSRKLDALTRAPPLPEDYSGPALLVGRAAGWFFLTAVGEPLSHPRDPLGRSTEGRLTERLGKQVAAPMVTVRDDPTMKLWQQTPLLGGVPVDDDGVEPKPIVLVDKGVLRTFYMSRVPTRAITETNGHSREGVGSVGNLIVSTSKPESRSLLKKKLIGLVKQEDEPYGLLIEDLADSPADRRVWMSRTMREAQGGGDIQLPPPSLAYRVFADGREELVRAGTFKPMSFQALRDIVGMGDAPTVLSIISGAQSISVVAPAVLMKRLELRKPSYEFEKPAALPRPGLNATP